MLKNNFNIKNIPIIQGRTFIIAEVGSNHCGELNLAKEHIAAASQIGADAVKFQSLNLNEQYYKPSLEIKEIHKLIDFEENWHYELNTYANSLGIIFSSSPTYLRAVDLLCEAQVGFIKIASAQLSLFPQLLKKIAKIKIPVLISSGISDYAELDNAVKIFEKEGKNNYGIFHCNSIYPTPPEKVNLNRITTYKKMFKCPIGFSDHTEGIAITCAAVAKGAQMIEKHFLIDRSIKTPDSIFSLSIEEFKQMILDIRSIESSLGESYKYEIESSEKKFKDKIKYKLILNKDKIINENLSPNDFLYLRNQSGIEVNYEDLICNNFVISKNLEKNTLLKWSDLRGK